MSVGFIILRHVNNELTNKYWFHSYSCIRKFYPENLIIIIDDNSNYNFIDLKQEESLYKTTIIKSEFPKRGELLPYYYYLKNKLFDTAVIIHDSVFINKYIDFSSCENYKMLWSSEHNWDQIDDETNMIKLFKDDELLKFYQNKNKWNLCFGGMSCITHDYLKVVNDKYNLTLLLDVIVTRYNRCSFERVIGCLLHYCKDISVFGDIHRYCPWGITFNDKEKFNNLPFIKVWTGR